MLLCISAEAATFSNEFTAFRSPGGVTPLNLTNPANAFRGAFSGSGAGVSNVNAATLNADEAISRLSDTNNLFVFLGDSITSGLWNSNGWSLVQQAALQPFFVGRGFITNAAVSGTHATNGITVFTNAIVPLMQSRAWDAVYVFTMFGANEMISGVVTNSFASVSNWVNGPYWLLNSNIVGNGAIHIVETPTYSGNNATQPFRDPIISEMAYQLRTMTNAPLVVSMHDMLPDASDTSDFNPDNLHPNNFGSRKLARRLSAYMLNLSMFLPEKAESLNVRQLNGNNVNLVIGSSTITQTKLHLSVPTGTAVNFLGFSSGAAANTREVGFVGSVYTAGSGYLGSLANDTAVMARGGGDVVLGTSVNTTTFQRDMFRLRANGNINILSNLSVGLVISGDGGGLTNLPLAAIKTGNATPVAVTVGASPFTFVNATPHSLECYFSGATAFAVSKQGVGVYGSLAGDAYFILPPTNECVVTYTVVPTFYTNKFLGF